MAGAERILGATAASGGGTIFLGIIACTKGVKASFGAIEGSCSNGLSRH